MSSSLDDLKLNPPSHTLDQSLRFKRLWIFATLMSLGCLVDLVTKSLVFSWRGLPGAEPVWWLVSNWLGVETSVNHGALFGLGFGYSWVFATLSFVAILGIGYWLLIGKAYLDRVLNFSLGVVSGGILGNLYDRLGLWHAADTPENVKFGVRDWILFQWQGGPLKILDPWPNFNIADSLLVCGALILIWHSWTARETATS